MSLLVSVRPATDAGAGASFTSTGTFTPGPFALGEARFTPLSEASWDLQITPTGECVHVCGAVEVAARTACARCLEDFELTIAGSVEELFYREPTFDEHGDALPTIDDEGRIDLEPSLREALLVAAPFKALHDENCRGICPDCGANLNSEDCRCAPAPDPSHPLAALKDLIDTP
jgi:uncharacterized protein